MPYIPKDKQLALAKGAIPDNAGQLNYVITSAVLTYLHGLGREPKYEDYNAVIGALESAKLEFYRRCVAEYENEKILRNGDIYKGE